MLRKHVYALGACAALLSVLAACDTAHAPASPLRAESRVTVHPKVLNVEALGEVAQLSAEVATLANTSQRPYWTSLNPAVAVVDADGRVVSVARGQAQIVVAAAGAADTAIVNVTQTPASLEIVVPGLGVRPPEVQTTGQEVGLAADVRDRKAQPIPDAPVTWTTLDPMVVAVKPNGTVEPKGNGNGRVVGRSGNASDTLNFNVQLPAVAIEVAPTTHMLTSIGETVRFAAEGRDVNGGVVAGVQVIWQVQPSSVASIAADGTLTARANGSANVTAKSGNLSGSATVTVQQVAANVIIQPGSMAVVAAQSQTATATVVDARGNPMTGASVSWSTAHGAIATVDGSGRVTGRAPGSTTLTASAAGRSATIPVTVTPAPVATVTVAPASASVERGSTLSLTATTRDAAGSVLDGRTVTWSSGNTSIATVSSNGVVTGLLTGTVTISATSEGRTGTAQISVTPSSAPVAAVSVAPASVVLQIGGTAQLSATPLDAAGAVLSGRTITWASSNPAVATVTSTGRVTALGGGTAVITATSEGRSGSANVSVPCTLGRVVVGPKADTLRAVGETRQLSATVLSTAGTPLQGASMTWVSLSPSVATVTNAGLVTAKDIGTALIVVTATLGGCTESDTAGLVVEQVVESITLTPNPATVQQGSTIHIDAVAVDAKGVRISNPHLVWSSAQPTVASVNGNGDVTGLVAGTTQIRATSTKNGKFASANVQVTSPPPTTPPPTTPPPSGGTIHSVALSPTAISLATGATRHFEAVAKDSANKIIPGVTITWSSSNPAVVSVDQTGTATGVATGSAILTASAGGKNATAAVNVTAPPSNPPPPTNPPTVASVTLTPASASVAVGATTTLQATARDSANNVIQGATITWSSSATGIATVSVAGVVTGVAAGTATITATSGGKSATAAITVTPSTAPPPPPPGGPLNEPAGMTTLVHTDGATKFFTSGVGSFSYSSRWNNDTYVQVVPDAQNPSGSGFAIEKRYFAGDKDGWHGYANRNAYSTGGYSEQYFRARIKFSPNWDHHVSNGQKLWYFGTTNRSAATDFFVAAWTLNSSEFQIRFIPQVTDAFSGQGAMGRDGNQGSWKGSSNAAHRVKTGEWFTLEVWMKAQSAPGVADGELKMWLNGTALLGHWTGLEWLSSSATGTKWNGVQSFLYWGGQGDTKQVDDYVRLGEFYVSGRK